MAFTAVPLANVPTGVIPRVIADPIFNRTIEQSAIMSQPNIRRIPLALNAATTIPVSMDIPTAGWVAEGGAKPVSTESMTLKTMTGQKVAVILPVSAELAMTNTGGLFDQIQQDLPVALARALDLACLLGITPSNSTPGSSPFGANYIAATTNAITLGTASQAHGGVYADTVGAEQLLVNGSWVPNGWIVDPRLTPILKLATDTMGRPLYQPGVLSGPVLGSLNGLPVTQTPAVSALVNRQSARVDSTLRAFLGDWSQCALGVGMDITIDVSNQASYVDSAGTTHSAFQENLVLLRAEAYFGFVVGDPTAFAKIHNVGYTGAAGS